MKKTLTELRKASVQLFEGELTISKRECWMMGAILVLTGIAIGLINAPLTHGVNISLCSNNGSGNGNNNSGADCNGSAAEDKNAANAAEKNELCKADAIEEKKRAWKKRVRKNCRRACR